MEETILYPKYDETLELLKKVAKILEGYATGNIHPDIQYSSDSLTPYTSYSPSIDIEEVSLHEDSIENNNGTYVVSTESRNSLKEQADNEYEGLSFPYVEAFIERIRLIKENCSNKNFDAFWINLSELPNKSEYDIDVERNEIPSMEIINAPNISHSDDNFFFLFFSQFYVPEKESLVIEEIIDNDKSIVQCQTYNIAKSVAEKFVNSLIDEALCQCEEIIISRNVNNQQVCINQPFNSDNTTEPVNMTCTRITSDNNAIIQDTLELKQYSVEPPRNSIRNPNEFEELNKEGSEFSSHNEEIWYNNDFMPIEFKYLLYELNERKSKIKSSAKTKQVMCIEPFHKIRENFKSNVNLDVPISIQTETKLHQEGRGIKNNEIIIAKEFKEVTDGCGDTVGAEERFVDTERVGRLNNVSSHRDGPQPNTRTINIQSYNSFNTDVCCVNSFPRISSVGGSSECNSESLLDIEVYNLSKVKVFAENRNDYEHVTREIKMRDCDEVAPGKPQKDYVTDYVDVLNNVNSHVKCEIKSPDNGYDTSKCEQIRDGESTIIFSNNNTSHSSGNIIGLTHKHDTFKRPYINGNHSVKILKSSDHNGSFKKVNGGQNFRVFHAPVRKLMSRSRKYIRSGKRRDARKRVASIRRSDVTPQPSVKEPPFCAGCLLLRVAQSGPFLLLDLSTTESKSEKTFTNKLLSLGHVCPCNRKHVEESSGLKLGDYKDNNTTSNSLQVTNIGADKSTSSKESENLKFKHPSKLYSEKQIPVSFITLKNNTSDLENNSLANSEYLSEHFCNNSFTNLPSDKAGSDINGFLPSETNNPDRRSDKLNETVLFHNSSTDKETKYNLCISNNIRQEKFSANEKSLTELEEKSSDTVDVLTSRVLNSFEVSSRLKRLEEKLRSSLESLKDSSIKEVDGENNPDDICAHENAYRVEPSLIERKLNVCDQNIVNKSEDTQQINLYRDSIKNNLEEFLKIHRDLKINEFCTQKSIDEDSCPTKNLLDERKEHQSINESNHKKENSFEFSTDIESDIASDAESKELEEFERQERWASNEEYFSLNASIFASSSCQFSVSEVTNLEFGFDEPLKCYDELLDSSESLSSVDEETVANTLANSNMRGEGPAIDRRHNKDASNLKSLLKKATRKGKKNRVVFNENKNEFFEADYIILIREECQYDEESDEGVCTCSQHEMVRLTCCEGDCNGCEQDDSNQEGEPVTLSPPEGYKDSGMFHKDGTIKEQGLFNKDGTLRDQGLFARPGGLLVGESSGTVFSPQHLHQLQLIQRLQREQLRRAKVALGSQGGSTGISDEGLEDRVEDDDPEEEITLLQPKLSYAKEIVAGEERPKVNSGQQTTPTDEIQRYVVDSDRRISDDRDRRKEQPNEDNRTEQISTHQSSPMRLGGILKGGRMWKATTDGIIQNDQTEDSSNFRDSASDEEGRVNRAVRFSEPSPSQCGSQLSSVDDPSDSQDQTDSSSNSTKPELTLFRIGSHLLANNSLRPNSAVRQLFPSGPHYITQREADKQYLVTAESLRAFEEGKRSRLPTNYRDEDLTVRRTIDRNTLRRSLVKVDAKKKISQKSDTSLSERIKMLTCNIDDEDVTTDSTNETERCSPSTEETLTPVQLPTKCFSPSSSSSSASSCSSTSSTYKKLTDIFPKRQERIPECIEEGNGVVIIPQNDKIMGSIGGQNTQQDTNSGSEKNVHDQPAPDVLAGTPGAGEGDELARFVQQESARTERLRKKYNQQTSTENSDDDDQDDYGFSDRPAVRGIKPRFGSTNEILQQMQTQLMPQQTPRPSHISWPYYSESNLTMPAPHEHTLHHSMEQTANRPLEDYHQQAAIRLRERLAMQGQRDILNAPHHEQQHENIYQNCMTYVNLRCNGSERDLYASQPHMAHMHSYARQHRRPESPPPIRSYHQTMVLLPYSNLPNQPQYSNTAAERNYHNVPAEHNNINEYPTLSYPKQKDHNMIHMKQGQQTINIPFQPGVPMQLKCSAPMAHIRTVQPRPLAQQMICFSEKVKAPLYQAAPGSPGVATTVSGNSRGVPEGAPATAPSPTAPQNQPHQHNSLYYAMNV